MSISHWNDSLSTGHPVVDQQHQQLINAVNQLYDVLHNGRDKQVIGEILDMTW